MRLSAVRIEVSGLKQLRGNIANKNGGPERKCAKYASKNCIDKEENSAPYVLREERLPTVVLRSVPDA